MRLSDNFEMNLVEGSDVVNLLTQMNPNTEKIDEQMFKNQNTGVQVATELLTGTVHAITRTIPDASMMRFTAVSRFTVGDTFTVDGVQVSALLPSGEQLPDGAFIIGSEVLCVLKGTLLTVYAGAGAVALAQNSERLGGELPEYYGRASEVESALSVANSAGALAETNRQSITELNTDLEKTKNNIDNSVMEFGQVTTSGDPRTITLKNNYSSMKYFNVSLNGSASFAMCRDVIFTAPNKVSFRTARVDGGAVSNSHNFNYIFIGE